MSSTFESQIVISHIRRLFISAGWCPSNESEWTLSTISPSELPNQVIKEFGALRVGITGPGTEQASSDVHFYKRLNPDGETIVRPWTKSLGRLQSIATAHHDHMIIFVGCNGSIFAFTDPDDQLYRIGDSFAEGMIRLFFGYKFEQPIPRDD